MASDQQAFVRSQTRRSPVAYAPEIELLVADEATGLWHMTEVELGAVCLPPPFWAFAWAGGQALARYLIDHQSLVADKWVLDFASGSGLVAIAAAKAGARKVEASEIDQFALAAIALNAELNKVDITLRRSDVVGLDEGWEVVVAGDVSYERDMAARVTDWLEALAQRGACVLVGDPGRAYLARDRLHSIACYPIPVTREIEDAEIKSTGVWQFNSTPPSARAPAVPRAQLRDATSDGHSYSAVQPPSIDKLAPVMLAAASEQR
jgi:predicted nicotinamide N-methyase